MKYMIMMNSPRDGYAQFMSWPKEILEAHFAFIGGVQPETEESGEWVSADDWLRRHRRRQVESAKMASK